MLPKNCLPQKIDKMPPIKYLPTKIDKMSTVLDCTGLYWVVMGCPRLYSAALRQAFNWGIFINIWGILSDEIDQFLGHFIYFWCRHFIGTLRQFLGTFH